MAKVKPRKAADVDPRFSTSYETHRRLMKNFIKGLSGKSLALDLGMKYGFAYIFDQIMVYGYNDVSPTPYSTQATAAIEFYKHIRLIDREVGGLDSIFFEDVRGTKGLYAMKVNGAFVGAMEAAAYECNIKLVKGYTVGQIKIFGTGKGNAGKDKMIKAANDRYGLSMDPENEVHGNMADAIHLLALGREALHGDSPIATRIISTERRGNEE